MIQVPIRTEFIKLDTFLKLSGITETGGQAKQIILSGRVFVNGEKCFSRGKKLREKDVVECKEKQYEVSRTGNQTN